MFDYHVHVTGSPIFPNVNVKDKLKNSLIENGINRFVGIVSAGSFFKKVRDLSELLSISPDLLFDNDYNGIKTVRQLGGLPAVMLYPTITSSKFIKSVLNASNENDITILKIYADALFDASIIKESKDNGFKTVLAHTPINLEVVKPLFQLAYSMDMQLILGHGCVNSEVLMSLVKEFGAYVDTSNEPTSNIKKWIDNNLMDNLVFGSDWPSPGANWSAQKDELVKLNGLELPESFYNKNIFK